MRRAHPGEVRGLKRRLVYAFDDDHPDPPGGLAALLGGKGAGLAAMTEMGLPVPPGFTITTEACRSYLADGWTGALETEIRGALAGLEHRTGRRLGDPDAPLLVSVRSGAAISMPGMLETKLEVGQSAEEVLAAVRDVFDSWNSDQAARFRSVEAIDAGIGTAATVQTMVFGDRDDDSGSGVAFTRDPSTGEQVLMGDFLIEAPGSHVVAGDHDTLPLVVMRRRWPAVWDELAAAARALELAYADMVDIEFTVQQGVLWLLQVRRAKRSPQAAMRAAVEMAEDPGFPLDRAGAVERCRALLDDPPTVGTGDPVDAADVVVTGLAAAPGRGIGTLCLDVDAAVDARDRGVDVVLVRSETSPADVRGMAASVGLVTTHGGLVSHAAVVARSWGLPAVVGAAGLRILDDAIEAGGLRVAVGDVVTVDGDGGRLLRGAHPGGRATIPEVAVLRRWAEALEPPADRS